MRQLTREDMATIRPRMILCTTHRGVSRYVVESDNIERRETADHTLIDELITKFDMVLVGGSFVPQASIKRNMWGDKEQTGYPRIYSISPAEQADNPLGYPAWWRVS